MVEHPDDLGQVGVQRDGDLPQDADGWIGLGVLVPADRLAFQPGAVGHVLQAQPFGMPNPLNLVPKRPQIELA